MRQMVAMLCLGAALVASANELPQYMETLTQQAMQTNGAFQGFDAKRGEKIFHEVMKSKKGVEISCASCHGNDLKAEGKNTFTGKVIEPLSPKTNPQRLSSIKSMEKWLRRNFNDVYNREGTALEKGDVLTYILAQ